MGQAQSEDWARVKVRIRLRPRGIKERFRWSVMPIDFV